MSEYLSKSAHPSVKQQSAIHSKRLLQLFFQPKRYFQDLPHLDRSKVYLLAYLLGIFVVMDRIDTQMIKAELNSSSNILDFTVNNWINYWGFVLTVGLFGGFIAWHLYGWWYEFRLKRSGVSSPDLTLAKQVNVLQWMSAVVPIIAVTIIQTLLYQNYNEAYYADEIWSVIIVLVTLIYSCLVSFIAAKTVFQVNRWGIFFFFFLPLLFYSIVFFAVGVMFLAE